MALILLLLLLLPSPAHAGTYDVYACRLTDGSSVPTRAWTAFETYAGGGIHATTADDCATGGVMSATLAASGSSGLAWAGSSAGWRFIAPEGTTIAGFDVQRYASSSYLAAAIGWGGYVLTIDDVATDASTVSALDDCFASPPAGVADCSVLGTTDDPWATENRYTRADLNGVRRIALTITCASLLNSSGAECIGEHDDVLGVFAARVTVDDSSAPRFTRPPVVGSRVSFAGADAGGGLTDGALVVDGTELGRVPVNGQGATCHPPYVDAVPCPISADVSVPLDLGSLANGAHSVQAVLYDVAGNRSASALVTFFVNAHAILGPAVAPVPGPNGTNATRFARLRSWFAGRSKRTVKTLAYGQRGAIEGVLTTAAGVPIAGAALSVEERELGSASRARSTATVTTDGKGRFAYRTGTGPSRTIRISYRAFPEDPSPVVVSETTIHVRAGVSLRVTPNHVRNGSVITFRGVVRGKQRAIVTIYALAGGPRKRIPVETVRAGSDGRFVYRYRFRSIPAPTTYRFVAVVPKQNGFPYSEGESGSVAVRGRP